MNRKVKGLLGLLVLLAVTAGFCLLGYRGAKDIKLGLDLNGGVSITYQTVEENPTNEQMSDTVYKLQLKAQSYSTEAQVYQEGANRINIDIPGVTDANKILAELGEPGTLQFMDSAGTVLLTGDDVKNAQPRMSNGNGTKEYSISLTFTEAGAAKFASATEANLGKPIYIVYNNQLVSAPTVQAVITGGEASITGIQGYEEATTIASTIRIGALPVQLTELRSNVIGATLGQEAISTSLKAAAVGIALVMLFMLLLYRLPGLAASIALLLYIGLELVLLQAFEITLTLPGIAGIILSIGMAVDANVIIFTRIKEEIGLGSNVEDAVKAGYSKALSAILDGNITTLIAAAVLYIRGSGTVKGFASTLAIGIVISLITALFVTRGIMNAFFAMGADKPLFYGSKGKSRVFDFIAFRKLAYTISAIVILGGFVFMGMNRQRIGSVFNFDLDFQGGSSTNITFNEDMPMAAIDSDVIPVFTEVTGGDSSTQASKVAGTNEVIIKTRTMTTEERTALYQKLVDRFSVDAEKITTENISGAVSAEMKKDAVWALLLSMVFMLLYIWIRFKDLKFAGASVFALCHDVLVTVAFYAALRWAVGSTFIACILTIVGYSINATIVIFDRIRENLAKPNGRRDLKLAVNDAVSTTLTRSVNTSLTTFVTVLMLYLFGVSSIRDFTLPLMVGIISGAWSSVFIAGPLWYDLVQLAGKRSAAKKAAAKSPAKKKQ
ncbi:MAG: protein translocase subunit SecD [Oribacterium sp.]